MSNEYEQPVEPMSRTEDLLRTGTEEPVIAMSEIEKILRGEHIDRPHSRVADLLLQYNPSDILIEKRIEENGTYYATADAADGYYKVVVDTPVIPPTVLEHLVETVSTNGTHTFTPGTGVDGFSDASITVDVAPNVGSKNITQNGNYAASSDNLDGYSNVNVNVAPNVGSKNITENGTYNASSDNLDGYSQVVVDVPPEPITETRTVENLPQPIASFNNGAEAPITSLKVAIEPQQDLHGYDAPWVGGAGKNKLQVTATTLTTSGVTFTVNADGTISTSGTATGNIDFYVGAYTSTGATYSANGCASGGEVDSTYWMFFGYMGADNGSGVANKTITSGNNITARIYVKSGVNMNGKVFKPMIEVGSTVTTFAPYSNISPISGWDEMDAFKHGKNFLNPNDTEYDNYTYGPNGEIVVADSRLCSRFYPCRSGEIFSLKRFDGSNIQFLGVVYFNKDKAFLGRTYANDTDHVSGTTPNNTAYIRAFISYGTGSLTPSVWGTNQIQLEKSASPTTYSPYNGQTYTIDLDGTHYGGEVDVVNGGGTDRFGYVDLSTLSWNYGSFGTSSSWKTPVLTNMKSYADGEMPNVLCEKYKPNTINSIYQNTVGIGIRQNGSTLYVNNQDSVNSPTGLLVYELATPTTYETQPTPINSLKGDNNVYANTGNINDLDYIYVNDEVGTLINKSITANGSYCAVTDDNADGYLNIDVNLPDGTNTEY